MQPATWQTLREQGSVLVKSGFLPVSVKTPEQAIAIMMKGYELGMQPMQAFSSINVIQGKPTLSAEGMLAQIWKSIPNAFIDFVRIEDDYCEIHAARPGRTPRKFIFQKSDAEKAGLLKKDNWTKYPRAMHKARCISEMARTIFPDALMGCSHTAEELNPDINVSEEGIIIDVEPEKKKDGDNPPAPPPAPDEEPFSLENEDKVKRMKAWLVSKGISNEALDPLLERLVGAKKSEMPAIIKKFQAEIEPFPADEL